MRRFTAVFLVCSLLLGASAQPQKPQSAFDILGASVNVQIARAGTTLKATQVPYLDPGDVIEISFPKGVQFSRSPRWHLVVANMYNDYLQHPPTFAIPDADLSHAKAGAIWNAIVQPDATPLIFLVPEDGSRYGHGIPDARAAITELSNRALLLRTADLSASAEAKASTMNAFLKSLASIQPEELPDGRARVASTTEALFGSDLGDSACFATTASQSTQYACAAQAVAAGYGNTPKAAVGSVIGNDLPIGMETYGMLLGTLYELLAKRRVAAHYIFVPGTMKPGTEDTHVYVNEQPEYDAAASKPSTIVYFTVGSRGTSPKLPSYGNVPKVPVCLASRTLEFNVTFSGLPIYFRSHTVTLKTPSSTFDLSATYDPLLGYRADLSAEEFARLAGGGTAALASDWGFDALDAAPIAIVEPHIAPWTLQNSAGVYVVEGDKHSALTFTDGGAKQGGCVESVTVRDGLGRSIPVSKLDRTSDSVTATLDASNAGGATGNVVIHDAGGSAMTPIAFPVFPALPSITSAIAFLPKGVLVLKGTGLKYIDTVTLEGTGITFGSGTPHDDGSWVFAAQDATSFKSSWEHETMAISFTLQPPDSRTDAVEADVEYAPSQSPSPAASPMPSPRARVETL